MGNTLEDLTFRPPTLEDAERTLELIIRGDVAAYGEADSDMEDLLHDWGQIDLERDGWLAFGPEGDLVGYAAVLPWGDDLHYEIQVDPRWPGYDLSRALLARCEERGASIIRGREGDGEVMARTFVAHVNERDRAILTAAGFQPGRYYFQMWIDMSGADGPANEPEWPAGVSVRTFVEGQDERATYELIEAAFDQPGRNPATFEDWRAHMKRADIFDAGLWFLAVAGEEIVGACLAFLYPTGGWVRQLGVDARWRRKGVGAALLSHAFGEFKKRGHNKVGLSVESYRPDAFTFYQRVGMKQERQYDEFIKPI